MTFTCNCGKTVEYDQLGTAFNIGAAQDATGWTYLLMIDGDGCWLCAPCADEATALAKQLVDVVGNSDFHFRSLVLDLAGGK